MQIRKSILDQISTLRQLPTLPHILLKLIRACNRERGSLKEISAIIENDPSLTSKILRLVNSAYYALPRKIGSMDQAVAYLGTNAVKNTAICASVFGAFNQTRGDPSFNMKIFWWHSLRCAVLARLIAKKTQFNDPDEAFLSGLLHDIGRLVLWVNFRKEYKDLMGMYKGRSDLLLAGEIRLGATHCEIGAWLLQHWKLPSFMADSVLYHHEPVDRIFNALPLVQIVYVSNALSGEPSKLEEAGFKTGEAIFGFNRSEMEGLLTRTDREVEEVARSLDVEIEPPGEDRPPSENDLEKQEGLIREVRDASLLLGTLQNLLVAEDETAVFKEIQQGLMILFDLRKAFFFLLDSEKNALLGKAIPGDAQSSMIEDLLIPMRMGESLLVRSLNEAKPTDSFGGSENPTPVILDEQIIRFIGKEGILSIPMIAYGEPVGVIALGLEKVEFSHLSKELSLLNMFTNQVALALRVLHLKPSQLKVVQSERLGASTSMARRVVHEVNNPLSIIKNYLKILGGKLAAQNIAQDEIRIISEEIDRVVLILRDLTAFSHSDVNRLERVDINALLWDLVKITKESMEKDSAIFIHTAFEPSLPWIMADKNALKQVFINIIKNASEAMGRGGNLYLQTRHLTTRLGETRIQHGEGEQGYVEVAIRDDGPGIPDEVKARLFEPFVTSKSGGHSGLGLSISHNIIKSLSGTLDCESSKDKGTAFRIALPVIRKQET
jgi:HD-like signal output (HDOD) protein/nitrogen-specific signal transduction histidine kinase